MRSREDLAERIAVAEVSLREYLVDHGNQVRSRVVRLDFAAQENRNLHRGKEARAHRHHEAGSGLAAVYAHARHHSPSNQRNIGKAGAEYAGNGGELLLKMAVERADFRVDMARLTGIELEGEHVFAIESEINRFQAREGANEQSRGHQNHQADGDLCHHQCAAQRQASRAARGCGVRCLERGHQIDSRGCP